MKKEVKNCLTWLINKTAETIIYDWSNELKIENNKKSFKTFYEEIKKHIDFTKITVEEAKRIKIPKMG